MHDPCLMKALFISVLIIDTEGRASLRFLFVFDFWISLLDRSLYLFRFPFSYTPVS
jgi:hypothetical protein